MFSQVLVVNDYHDIDYIAGCFPSMKLSSYELGMCQVKGVAKYVGLVYEGCRPGPGEVEDLLREAKVTLIST